MLESVKKLKELDKKPYKQKVTDLRGKLVEVQQELRKQPFPVLILFAGVDGAGKHETVDLLNAWLDPRWLITRAYGEPTEEERQRPDYWRYWRDLPAFGQIGLYLSAWYSKPLLERVKRQCPDKVFESRIERINSFERTLVDNGALILKFYMLLDKESQEERLKQLASDPLTAWQVKPTDWEHWALYDRFIETSDKLLEATHRKEAPWHVIDASALNARSITVADTVHKAIRQRIEAERKSKKKDNKDADKKNGKPAKKSSKKGPLDRLDMDQKISKSEYEEQLAHYSAKLYRLQRQAYLQRKSVVAMFEGWDAAGKGGAIRRLTGGLDARHYQVIPIAAPTDEEKAHHYLWRFWRHLPRAGRVTIFDRSWYGRVLVERIEGFATEEEWSRAYREINEFEQELSDSGIILCKFWLHISKDEQERRFNERAKTPYKAWKLTDEDWRNRERWNEYKQCVHDILGRTDTVAAPWTIIEGDDKRFARIKVLRQVCERLEYGLQAHD